MSDADATLAGELGSGDTQVDTNPSDPRRTGFALGVGLGIGRGASIGRYLVLDKLGAGAMGVVLAAYDPELDRKVALKLLKPSFGLGDERSSARVRLQREAQALAKLDHPNVVGVHDVGVHGDQLFVAMELVAGQTLGGWLRESRASRSWSEIVSVFAAAGRGLLAAHEAGLTHRDFKPENVMLGDDGRVRVMDFGLARSDVDGDAAATPTAGGEHGKRRLHEAVTEAGALVGTLAYMAPEQFAGSPADARSDQFGFCVSLFEALYGQRPFPTDSFAALLEALEGEQVRMPARGSSVPTWLRKVVLRGLARDPAQRWPSMAALLDALLEDPAVRRRKGWLVLGLVGLCGASIWGVAGAQHEPAMCEGMDEKLAGVWDPTRRSELESAFLATKLGYAPATWERVEQHLDDYANAWVAAREDACQATQRGEQTGILLDLRMACLDERLDHLRATVHELASADANVVEKAVQAVVLLPSLNRCADVDALAAQVPPPEDPVVAERVVALDATLIEATAKQQAGRYDEALALVDGVVREATPLGYAPLVARASLEHGKHLQGTGEYEAAITALERAYAIATVERMTAEAASAAAWVMYVLGYDLARPEDGERWAVHAEPLSRATKSDALLADYFDSAGALAELQGKYDQARAHQEQVLSLRERELGPKHPKVASALSNLAIVAEAQGQLEVARGYYERVLSVRIEALGPEHPQVGGALINLGNSAFRAGRFADARVSFQRALEIYERAFGPTHPKLADALNGLGAVASAEDKRGEARELRQRALEILLASVGPEHPSVATVLGNLGNLAFDERELEQARDYYDRALVIREQVHGAEHPEVANLLIGLANVAYAERDFAASRQLHERALAIWEHTVGLDHPNVAFSLIGIGQVLLDEQQPGDAVAQLERALELRTVNEVDPGLVGEAQFLLARALWDADGDRQRALALVEAARASWADQPEWRTNAEAAEAWLAERR